MSGPRFNVGDIVRCIDQYGSVGNLPGLSYMKRFVVLNVETFGDGSQSLTVRGQSKSRRNITTHAYGPFTSTRFKHEVDTVEMFQYDPSQLGDLDDGI